MFLVWGAKNTPKVNCSFGVGASVTRRLGLFFGAREHLPGGLRGGARATDTTDGDVFGMF